MKTVVIGSPKSWYYDDLKRAGRKRNHEIIGCRFNDLQCKVECGVTRVYYQREDEIIDLAAVDAVLVRSMPPGSLEQIVFRMDALHGLESQGMTIINSPRAMETAVDKFLCLHRLQQAGIPVPKTIVCQTAEDALRAFEELERNVVVKTDFWRRRAGA